MMCVGVVCADEPPRQAQGKPNVVIIYGDDVGIGDVGFGGSQMIPTANIDKLALHVLYFSPQMGHEPKKQVDRLCRILTI